MLNEFITHLAEVLTRQGYRLGTSVSLPGLPALLYAASPQRFRLGFAKVEDHFLFVDWDNSCFGRLEHLLAIAGRFSEQVNQHFTVPHALRLQIPNLAVVALSPAPFPPDAVQFARSKNLTPWYGGETAQLILVSLGQRKITAQISTSPRRYPIPGALPLHHAQSVIRAACQECFIP